jgi:7,8-dihydro-6-hydroxymethylpterin dimethyltransferase
MKPEAIFINSSVAFCTDCGKPELARIMARPEGVFLERMCEREVRSVKIASDYKWYLERTALPKNIHRKEESKPIKDGCPKDCGLCQSHAGELHLPVFSITNDCNLDCPKCFTYNRPDKKYYKSISETKKILENIKRQNPNIELINLTGGEPTLHPELFDILKTCKDSGITQITMNTNGLKIASSPDFAEKIKEIGVHIVLSLDSLDPEKSIFIHGKDIVKHKLKALDTLEKLNIPTTILNVCIKDVNEEDTAAIVQEYIKKEFVRSVTIQNMTYTGKNGSQFQPAKYFTIDEVEKLISKKEGFSQDDFFSLGSYHPLCYSAAYYFIYNEKMIPLTKLLRKELLTQFSENSYLISSETDFSSHFQDGINNLWSEGADESMLQMLRQFIKELYPPDNRITPRQRRLLAQKRIKMVLIHPHMDKNNFDLGRISLCGDLVPDESGAMIPACAYNLIYRKMDTRFWIE